MKTYSQKTQDAAEELQLTATNDSRVQPALDRARIRFAARLKANPAATVDELKDCYHRYYAIARDVCEYSREYGPITPAVIHCAAQMQAEEDLAEYRINPQHFTELSPESIERFKQGYPAGYFRA